MEPNLFTRIVAALRDDTIDNSQAGERLFKLAKEFRALSPEEQDAVYNQEDADTMGEFAAALFARVELLESPDHGTEMEVQGRLMMAVLKLMPLQGITDQLALALFDKHFHNVLCAIMDSLFDVEDPQTNTESQQQLLGLVLQTLTDLAEAKLPQEATQHRRKARELIGQTALMILLRNMHKTRLMSVTVRRKAAVLLLTLVTHSKANQKALHTVDQDGQLNELFNSYVVGCGDFSTQLDLMETLFRLCKLELPHAAQTCIQNPAALKLFTEMLGKRSKDLVLGTELREVLGIVNTTAPEPSVHSFLAESIKYSLPELITPTDLWVDVGDKRLTLYAKVKDVQGDTAAEEEEDQAAEPIDFDFSNIKRTKVCDAEHDPTHQCVVELTVHQNPEALETLWMAAREPLRVTLVVRKDVAMPLLRQLPRTLLTVMSQDQTFGDLSQPLPRSNKVKMSMGMHVYYSNQKTTAVPAPSALPVNTTSANQPEPLILAAQLVSGPSHAAGQLPQNGHVPAVEEDEEAAPAAVHLTKTVDVMIVTEAVEVMAINAAGPSNAARAPNAAVEPPAAPAADTALAAVAATGAAGEQPAPSGASSEAAGVQGAGLVAGTPSPAPPAAARAPTQRARQAAVVPAPAPPEEDDTIAHRTRSAGGKSHPASPQPEHKGRGGRAATTKRGGQTRKQADEAALEEGGAEGADGVEDAEEGARLPDSSPEWLQQAVANTKAAAAPSDQPSHPSAAPSPSVTRTFTARHKKTPPPVDSQPAAAAVAAAEVPPRDPYELRECQEEPHGRGAGGRGAAARQAGAGGAAQAPASTAQRGKARAGGTGTTPRKPGGRLAALGVGSPKGKGIVSTSLPGGDAPAPPPPRVAGTTARPALAASASGVRPARDQHGAEGEVGQQEAAGGRPAAAPAAPAHVAGSGSRNSAATKEPPHRTDSHRTGSTGAGPKAAAGKPPTGRPEAAGLRSTVPPLLPKGARPPTQQPGKKTQVPLIAESSPDEIEDPDLSLKERQAQPRKAPGGRGKAAAAKQPVIGSLDEIEDPDLPSRQKARSPGKAGAAGKGGKRALEDATVPDGKRPRREASTKAAQAIRQQAIAEAPGSGGRHKQPAAPQEEQRAAAPRTAAAAPVPSPRVTVAPVAAQKPGAPSLWEWEDDEEAVEEQRPAARGTKTGAAPSPARAKAAARAAAVPAPPLPAARAKPMPRGAQAGAAPSPARATTAPRAAGAVPSPAPRKTTPRPAGPVSMAAASLRKEFADLDEEQLVAEEEEEVQVDDGGMLEDVQEMAGGFMVPQQHHRPAAAPPPSAAAAAPATAPTTKLQPKSGLSSLFGGGPSPAVHTKSRLQPVALKFDKSPRPAGFGLLPTKQQLQKQQQQKRKRGLSAGVKMPPPPPARQIVQRPSTAAERHPSSVAPRERERPGIAAPRNGPAALDLEPQRRAPEPPRASPRAEVRPAPAPFALEPLHRAPEPPRASPRPEARQAPAAFALEPLRRVPEPQEEGFGGEVEEEAEGVLDMHEEEPPVGAAEDDEEEEGDQWQAPAPKRRAVERPVELRLPTEPGRPRAEQRPAPERRPLAEQWRLPELRPLDASLPSQRRTQPTQPSLQLPSLPNLVLPAVAARSRKPTGAAGGGRRRAADGSQEGTQAALAAFASLLKGGDDEGSDEDVENEAEVLQAAVARMMASREKKVRAQQAAIMEEARAQIQQGAQALEAALEKEARNQASLAKRTLDTLDQELEAKFANVLAVQEQYNKHMAAAWQDYVGVYSQLDHAKQEVETLGARRRAAAKRQLAELQHRAEAVLADASAKADKADKTARKMPGLMDILRSMM